MGKIIGIDLGTTNSCVAIMDGKEPAVIVNEEGTRTTPSVVGFDDQERALVGDVARRQAVVKPKETVYSVKRMIGSKYDEVRGIAESMPYDVMRENNGEVSIQVGDKKYTPQEISAKVLQKLKRAAESYLGSEVTDAVITVPAYFNDSQRQATKDAGKIAGLEVKRIINEPTAAALAYGLQGNKDELIAVYDFGGGTFDVSVLEVAEGVVEVLATNGDTHLGGDNVDEVLIDHLVGVFKKDTGVDVSKDPMALQRLKEAAEKAKKELSSVPQADINLPFLTADATGPKHLNVKITRAKFESLISSIVEKTFESCKSALKDAGKDSKDINQVILVGGSTRIPMVLDRVSKFFGKDPSRGVNPDEVVALGAAVQGGVLSGDVNDILLLDVTPLSLGIETLGKVSTVLIPRNTTIPAKKSEIFSTADNNQTAVDIHVLQGERTKSSDNRTLGTFKLDGLPPAPRGVPQIEVSFDIDANGILNVSAKDKATGKEQKITITSSGGLSELEIEQLVKDAKENEADDKQHRELIEVRNKLDGMLFSAEKALKDVESEDDKTELKDCMTKATEALEANDIAAMSTASQDLEAAVYEIAKKVYEQRQTPPEDAEATEAAEEEISDVIDAEVVD